MDDKNKLETTFEINSNLYNKYIIQNREKFFKIYNLIYSKKYNTAKEQIKLFESTSYYNIQHQETNIPSNFGSSYLKLSSTSLTIRSVTALFPQPLNNKYHPNNTLTYLNCLYNYKKHNYETVLNLLNPIISSKNQPITKDQIQEKFQSFLDTPEILSPTIEETIWSSRALFNISFLILLSKTFLHQGDTKMSRTFFDSAASLFFNNNNNNNNSEKQLYKLYLFYFNNGFISGLKPSHPWVIISNKEICKNNISPFYLYSVLISLVEKEHYKESLLIVNFVLNLPIWTRTTLLIKYFILAKLKHKKELKLEKQRLNLKINTTSTWKDLFNIDYLSALINWVEQSPNKPLNEIISFSLINVTPIFILNYLFDLNTSKERFFCDHFYFNILGNHLDDQIVKIDNSNWDLCARALSINSNNFLSKFNFIRCLVKNEKIEMAKEHLSNINVNLISDSYWLWNYYLLRIETAKFDSSPNYSFIIELTYKALCYFYSYYHKFVLPFVSLNLFFISNVFPHATNIISPVSVIEDVLSLLNKDSNYGCLSNCLYTLLYKENPYLSDNNLFYLTKCFMGLTESKLVKCNIDLEYQIYEMIWLIAPDVNAWRVKCRMGIILFENEKYVEAQSIFTGMAQELNKLKKLHMYVEKIEIGEEKKPISTFLDGLTAKLLLNNGEDEDEKLKNLHFAYRSSVFIDICEKVDEYIHNCMVKLL